MTRRGEERSGDEMGEIDWSAEPLALVGAYKTKTNRTQEAGEGSERQEREGKERNNRDVVAEFEAHSPLSDRASCRHTQWKCVETACFPMPIAAEQRPWWESHSGILLY